MSFWKDKKVLITGHTGFKGSWLSLYLKLMGAHVFGYALEPERLSIFNVASVGSEIEGIFADIRNLSHLEDFVQQVQPELLFHLAAQPLVHKSYLNPIETVETNVIGSSNVLFAAQNVESVKAVINITTDKCYENKKRAWSYNENDRLGGSDVYSASKACVEILNTSFYRSFYKKKLIGLATARAGNVIGGGDWGEKRLVPDVLSAIDNNTEVILRNPNSTRPWQHVMECISGYTLLAQNLLENPKSFSEPFNFGPSSKNTVTVTELIESLFGHFGLQSNYKTLDEQLFYEEEVLSLDSSKARKTLNWSPRWSIKQTCESIAEWHNAYRMSKNMNKFTKQQILQFIEHT